MSSIAIIPARSGSKGLIDKNIKKLNNKPLMAYSIEAAIESKMFDSVVVSTDSEEYALIAKKYGAEVPFLREASLANDLASSWDVVEDVLRRYEKSGVVFENFMLLQPTSPLRSDIDIIEAYKIMKNKNAQAVVSVCEVDHSPLWSNTLPTNQSLACFIDDKNNIQRQKLEQYYRINGAIYLINTEFFYSSHEIYRKGCYAYIMDKERSIDIDTYLDFKIAETILDCTYNLGGSRRI